MCCVRWYIGDWVEDPVLGDYHSAELEFVWSAKHASHQQTIGHAAAARICRLTVLAVAAVRA